MLNKEQKALIFVPYLNIIKEFQSSLLVMKELFHINYQMSLKK